MKFEINKINLRRLWLFVTVVWVAVVIGFYWDDVLSSVANSSEAKAAAGRQAQYIKFNSCLSEHGTNWMKLVSEYGERCRDSVREGCRGTSWCAEDLLFDLCIKRKSPCGDMWFVTPEFLEELAKSSTWPFAWSEVRFYLGSRHSKPLKTATLLVFMVPIFLAMLPRGLRRLWRWLTGGGLAK